MHSQNPCEKMIQFNSMTKLVNRALTIFGNANTVMARFLPISLHKYPKVELPTTPPTHKIAPIQLVSSRLIDPVESGDESDCRRGRYGESQPKAHPCDKLMILAVKE